MLKHMLCACKINQRDNKLVIRIIQTWFEIDRTGYTSYCTRISYPKMAAWSNRKKVMHIPITLLI